jgi:hypothetical protein
MRAPTKNVLAMSSTRLPYPGQMPSHARDNMVSLLSRTRSPTHPGQSPPVVDVLTASWLPLEHEGAHLRFSDTPKALVVVDVARRRIDGRRPPAARARSDQHPRLQHVCEAHAISTALRGQVINESLGQLPKKLAAGPRVLARTESSRTQSGTKQGGPPHDH